MKNTKQAATKTAAAKDGFTSKSALPARVGCWNEQHGVITPGSFRVLVGKGAALRCLGGAPNAFGDRDEYLVLTSEAEARKLIQDIYANGTEASIDSYWEIQVRRNDGYWVLKAAGVSNPDQAC